MLAKFRLPIGWGELLKRSLNEMLDDDAFNLAAQQAYYFFFALFPALLAVISIASFFPVANLTSGIVEMLAQVAPRDVVKRGGSARPPNERTASGKPEARSRTCRSSKGSTAISIERRPGRNLACARAS